MNNCILQFQSDRQRKEWELDFIDPRLKYIIQGYAYFMFCMFNKATVIAVIGRTKEEQRLIYPDEPFKVSVHEFDWRGLSRGCDLSIKWLTEDEITAGLVYLNKFQYSELSTEYKTANRHTVITKHVDGTETNHGDHIHTQVHWAGLDRLTVNF